MGINARFFPAPREGENERFHWRVKNENVDTAERLVLSSDENSFRDMDFFSLRCVVERGEGGGGVEF